MLKYKVTIICQSCLFTSPSIIAITKLGRNKLMLRNPSPPAKSFVHFRTSSNTGSSNSYLKSARVKVYVRLGAQPCNIFICFGEILVLIGTYFEMYIVLHCNIRIEHCLSNQTIEESHMYYICMYRILKVSSS